MQEDLFLATVAEAWGDLRRDLQALGPSTGHHLLRWFTSLRGAREPWRYLTDVRAFPLLRLPWLAEEALTGSVDRQFQHRLLQSSIAGYLHIRLVDDSSDVANPTTVALLPALGPLHLLFEQPYREVFPDGHPFFGDLRRLWTETAEATLRDGLARDIDAREYRRSAARKTRAALIPIQAVLHRLGRLDQAGPWDRFVTDYGRWHQLEDDTFDWREDLAHGRETWLIGEARRRAGPDDIGGWVVREGLSWACDTLDRFWQRARSTARALRNPGLDEYLDRRLAAHRRRRRRHLAAHRSLSSLVARLRGRLEALDGARGGAP